MATARRERFRRKGTTHAAASAEALERGDDRPVVPVVGEAVGGAPAADVKAAAKQDGGTFVGESQRARAHVRKGPPGKRKAGPVELPDAVDGVVGAPIDLLVGKERHPGAFVVVEVDTLITSHNPHGFAVEPRYPPGVQERDYTRDPYERRKVEDNAARMIPDYLINNNPDSVNGPPVCAVVGDGVVVLGGNSRAMSLRLAYENGHGHRYRALLGERAGIFGLVAADLDPFKAPALVRVHDVAVTVDVSRALNEAQTLDKSATVDAVSASHRLSARTLQILAEHVSPDETIDAYLSSHAARPLVRALLEDRVITPQEAPRLLAGPDLSEDGRDHVRRVLVAALIPDVTTIDSLQASQRDTIARALPALFEARRFGHDLGPDLRAAVDDIADAAARKVAVEDLDKQGSMFELTATRSRTSSALRLRSLLQSPRRFVRALRTFAVLAQSEPAGQISLLGEARSTADLLEAATHAVGDATP